MKLAEIGRELNERVPKTGHNDHANYDYVTEADLVALVREKLFSRNIVIYPAVTTCKHTQYTGKKSILTTVELLFRIEDGDSGDHLDLVFVGVGQDTGDKGIYKAITGAEKHLLMKLFLLPSGDDPEKTEPKTEPKEATVDDIMGKPDPAKASTDWPTDVFGIHDMQEKKSGTSAKGHKWTIWQIDLVNRMGDIVECDIFGGKETTELRKLWDNATPIRAHLKPNAKNPNIFNPALESFEPWIEEEIDDGIPF